MLQCNIFKLVRSATACCLIRATVMPLQVIQMLPMLWICTSSTMRQGHGRRPSSVLRAMVLRPHRSETSPCSRVAQSAMVSQEVGFTYACVRVEFSYFMRATLHGYGVFVLRPLAVSFAIFQVLVPPMLLTCTTVQQGHGRRLSSVLRALVLRPHRSETSPCSREVTL